MSKTKKTAIASSLQSVGQSIAAGDLTGAAHKASAVLPRLEEYAEREAHIIDRATNERKTIWIEVIRGYSNDVPQLEKYPAMVRHAYAKMLGLNMSVSRKEWEPAQRKLYDSFCANQVSPLALIITLVGTKGAQPALQLLEGKGTIPAKVQQARIMLGRPVKTRQAKVEGGQTESTDMASQKVSMQQAEIAAKEQKKEPYEIAINLINTGTPTAHLPKVIQACAAKLKGSADPLDKLLGQWLEKDLTEYAKKADDDAPELVANEA